MAVEASRAQHHLVRARRVVYVGAAAAGFVRGRTLRNAAELDPNAAVPDSARSARLAAAGGAGWVAGKVSAGASLGVGVARATVGLAHEGVTEKADPRAKRIVDETMKGPVRTASILSVAGDAAGVFAAYQGGKAVGSRRRGPKTTGR